MTQTLKYCKNKQRANTDNVFSLNYIRYNLKVTLILKITIQNWLC